MLKRFVVSALAFCMGLPACFYPGQSAATNRLDAFPPIMLWAWERPEDLRFLDSQKFGIAFLAQTLQLTGDKLVLVPRRQPLKVSPSAQLMAVTRIETIQSQLQPVALSESQSAEVIRLVLKTLALKNVSAIQLDFDAQVSERTFYRRLLDVLRTRLPESVPLSITALASFCTGDGWISDLPVDEAVPMIFRMGEDAGRIRQFIKNGNDFPLPLCRQSVGIATDEPLPVNFAGQRRKYVFKGRPESWQPEEVNQLK